MNFQFDIEQLLMSGKISNELELEKALIVDRKLRILAKENPEFKQLRSDLRDLIEDYEKINWSNDSEIDENKWQESEFAEEAAELERIFIENRKSLIKSKLKKYNITQQQLGEILGHKHKSYISELLNGIKPFSLKDLIIINQLLKIDLNSLVPTFLPEKESQRIQISVQRLGRAKLQTNWGSSISSKQKFVSKTDRKSTSLSKLKNKNPKEIL